MNNNLQFYYDNEQFIIVRNTIITKHRKKYKIGKFPYVPCKPPKRVIIT